MISDQFINVGTKLGSPNRDGNFSTGIDWETCRERFQDSMTPELAGFYLSVGTQNETPLNIIDTLNDFIERVECILSSYVDMSVRTIFSRTTRPFICYVQPAPYWKTGWFEKSLFTLLLRSGLKHKIGESIEHGIKAYELANKTFPHIMRFMMGYTKINKEKSIGGNQFGWVELFNNQTVAETRQTLVRSQPDEEEIFVGYGTIYN